MRLRSRAATAIATISLVCAFALVPPVAAHTNPPTLTALHAFVGDPLWGLDSPQGTLVAARQRLNQRRVVPRIGPRIGRRLVHNDPVVRRRRNGSRPEPWHIS